MRSSPVPPPIWMLIFAAGQWLASRHWPLWTVVPAPYTRLGWAVMAIAVIAAASAFAEFRRAHTTLNPHKPENTSALVTSGVYAWTRNPMYLGLWLLLVGWAVRLGALSAFIVALLFIPLIGYVQIRAEERVLARRFGQEYERYRRRVRRWFGRATPG